MTIVSNRYGGYSYDSFSEYKRSLVDRIFALIPLREEKCQTLDENIERLIRELNGFLYVADADDEYIVTVMHLLANAEYESDFQAYRSDILRCCTLMNQLGGDE